MFKLNLIIPYYEEKNQTRNKEIIDAINRNVENKLFTHVVIVVENTLDVGLINRNPKLSFVHVSERQKFLDLFRFFKKDFVNIICNNDIILNFKSKSVKKFLFFQNYVIALTRFELDGTLFSGNRGDSQDTWIFGRNIEKELLIKNKVGDFYMGLLGCDNRLLFDFRKCGLYVFNFAWDYPTIHNHSSNVRNYNEENRLKGFYMWLRPTRIFSLTTILIYLSFHSYGVNKYLSNIGLTKTFNRDF